MKTIKILKIVIVIFISGSLLCYFIAPYAQSPEVDVTDWELGEFTRTGEYQIMSYRSVCTVFLLALFGGNINIPTHLLCMVIPVLTNIIPIILLVFSIIKNRNSKLFFILFIISQIFSATLNGFLYLDLAGQVKTFRWKICYGIYLNTGFIILALALSVMGLIIYMKQKDKIQKNIL